MKMLILLFLTSFNLNVPSVICITHHCVNTLCDTNGPSPNITVTDTTILQFPAQYGGPKCHLTVILPVGPPRKLMRFERVDALGISCGWISGIEQGTTMTCSSDVSAKSPQPVPYELCNKTSWPSWVPKFFSHTVVIHLDYASRRDNTTFKIILTPYHTVHCVGHDGTPGCKDVNNDACASYARTAGCTNSVTSDMCQLSCGLCNASADECCYRGDYKDRQVELMLCDAYKLVWP